MVGAPVRRRQVAYGYGRGLSMKILIEEFRRQFNELRPHSSLGQLTPIEFKQQLLTTDPNTAISKGV